MTDGQAHQHGHRPTAAPEVMLMADYGRCLWSNSRELDRFRGDGFNLDPLRLGVSEALVERMAAWHGEWEQMAYSNVGFRSPEFARAWATRGWEIAVQLQDELGPGIEVYYFHDNDGDGQAAEWNRPIGERQKPGRTTEKRRRPRVATRGRRR